MKRLTLFLAVVLSFGAFGWVAVRSQESKPTVVGGLSASFAVFPSTNPSAKLISAALILTNESNENIRVCTLCMVWKSGSNGKLDVSVTPNSWKSDSPTEDQLAQHVETLYPGTSAIIPFMMETGPTIELTGNYVSGEEVARKRGFWGGSVTAKRLTYHLK